MVKAKSDLGIISIQCFVCTCQYCNRKPLSLSTSRRIVGHFVRLQSKTKVHDVQRFWNYLVKYLTRCLNMFKSHLEQNQNNMHFRWKLYILLKLLTENVLCLLEHDAFRVQVLLTWELLKRFSSHSRNTKTLMYTKWNWNTDGKT